MAGELVIDTQRFELIRDAIGRVLAFELAPSCSVFLERLDPIDKEELPCLNIFWASNEQQDEVNAFNSRFNGTFIVEIYANSKATALDMNTDFKTSSLLASLMGKVRSVLMNQKYRHLDFTDKTIIEDRKVSAMHRTKPKQADTETALTGIVEFMVRFQETTSLGTGVLIGTLDTQVKIADTEKGYKYIIQ